MKKEVMRIVFMGTPDFAVESLRAICDAGYDVVGVVTMPDKPSGRGQKISKSAVKEFAEERGLKIMQPERLKDEAFVEELRGLKADLQIVVAFRMLPEIVWNMPPLGTYNLHASILPQYRGAAPINWAVMNGDKTTGVTTFKLKHEIDTGDVLLQKAIDILPEDDAGSVHDKLMTTGAATLIETLKLIEAGKTDLKAQSMLEDGTELRPAPKLFKEDMRLDWTKDSTTLHNKVRGLSPYPTAWTEIVDAKGVAVSTKIYKTSISDKKLAAGAIETDGKNYLMVGTADKALSIESLQAAGKKRMDIKSFLQGFHLGDESKCI
ncbi:MAG: methionyl-tRNA formyltransferase [Bacteroidales bacterium]|nr:methionyl-tRNA formyltransferase [Bacteroidales bacterium]